MDYKKGICFEFRRINNLIKRDIVRSRPESEIKQRGTVNGWMIGYLYDHMDEDIFQKDIENVFSIRRSTASNILKSMEKNGYIRREPVSYDARLKKITLTDKSIVMHKNVLQDIERREERLRQNISDSEIEAFFEFTEKIARNLD